MDALAFQFDMGNVPEWTSTAVALIAIILAALSLRATNRQLKDIQTEKRREQASSVAVWPEMRGQLVLVVANTSALPVFRARLWVVDTETMSVVWADKIGIVPPGGREIPLSDFSLPRRPRYSIGFSDNAARFWIRQYGSLTESTNNKDWVEKMESLMQVEKNIVPEQPEKAHGARSEQV